MLTAILNLTPDHYEQLFWTLVYVTTFCGIFGLLAWLADQLAKLFPFMD